MKHIYDPIHGFIRFTDDEIKILDTEQMQRLRNIKQLAFTYLIYPSATHTRFEHSIGVFKLASKIADVLKLNEDDTKNLKMASLLHDIGHGPFSHVTEQITGINHEKVGTEIIKNSHIKDFLETRGYDIKKINMFILGKGEIAQILNGGIDIDKIDYLLRDSYFTGSAYGNISADTIMTAAMLYRNQLVYREKFKLSVEALLTARYFMFPTVYMHHAGIIAENMLERAAKIEIAQKGNTIRKIDIINHTDHSFIELLKRSESNIARSIVNDLTKRNLFKEIYSLNSLEIGKERYNQLYKNIMNDKSRIEEYIAKKAGIDPFEIILTISRPPIPKEIETKIITENKTIYRIMENSHISKALQESMWDHTALKIIGPEKIKRTDMLQKASKEIISNYIS